MTASTAWFPCYPNDLLGSIRWKRMTPAQRGAYWQLICWQMQSDDGHFDDDIALLSALADLDLSNGNSIVIDSFPVQENGRRANKRALVEWAKRKAISNVRKQSGKDGGAKRWKKDGKAIANAIANATTTTTTTTDPHPEQQPKQPSASMTLDDLFDKFWQSYPRKVGKKAALKAWKSAKDKPGIDALVAAIESQKCSEAWRKDNGQYIPNPTTWLNQGRWDDETQNQTPKANCI